MKPNSELFKSQVNLRMPPPQQQIYGYSGQSPYLNQQQFGGYQVNYPSNYSSNYPSNYPQNYPPSMYKSQVYNQAPLNYAKNTYALSQVNNYNYDE
jgi:hypothetical protein